VVCDFRGKWKVSDGAEHEVITDRWEVKERGEGGEGRKREKLRISQDTVNYAYLHSKCTL